MCRSFALAPSPEECATCGACAPAGTEELLSALKPLQDIEEQQEDDDGVSLENQIRAALQTSTAHAPPALALLRSVRAAARRGDEAELQALSAAGCLTLLTDALRAWDEKSSANFVAWSTLQDLAGSLQLRGTVAAVDVFALPIAKRSRGKALSVMQNLAQDPGLRACVATDGARNVLETALNDEAAQVSLRGAAVHAALLLSADATVVSRWSANTTLQTALARCAVRDADASVAHDALQCLLLLLLQPRVSPCLTVVDAAAYQARHGRSNDVKQQALKLLAAAASRGSAARTRALQLRVLETVENELQNVHGTAKREAWRLVAALLPCEDSDDDDDDVCGVLPSLAQTAAQALLTFAREDGDAWTAAAAIIATPIALDPFVQHGGLRACCLAAAKQNVPGAFRALAALAAQPGGAALVAASSAPDSAATAIESAGESCEDALGLVRALAGSMNEESGLLLEACAKVALSDEVDEELRVAACCTWLRLKGQEAVDANSVQVAALSPLVRQAVHDENDLLLLELGLQARDRPALAAALSAHGVGHWSALLAKRAMML